MSQPEVVAVFSTNANTEPPPRLQRLRRWLRSTFKPPIIVALAVLLGSIITLFGLQPRLHELIGSGFSPYQLGIPFLTEAHVLLILDAVLAAMYFASAIVLISYQPKNRLVFFIALTLVVAGVVMPGMSDALINPEHSAFVAYFRLPVLSLRALGMIALLGLLYIFPDGRFIPRWTRILLPIWAVLNFLWLLIPPLPFNAIYGPTWRATPIASFWFHMAWISTGVFAQIYRYRRVADQIQRQQLKWTAAGLIVMAIGAAIYYGALAFSQDMDVLKDVHAFSPINIFLLTYGRPLAQLFFMAIIPMYCVFIAVQRYRLWQIDTIFNRALVYGALTLAIIAVYVLIVGILGTLLQTETNSLSISLVATGIVAVLFNPLRERLQRIVNRLLFGKRDDPLGVMSALGKQLEVAVLPESLLPSVVQMVGQTLRLPYVAIEATDGAAAKRRTSQIITASYGTPTEQAQRVRFPLIVQGQSVGALVASLRGQQEALSPADQQILRTIALQISPVVQALRLTADLQESRQRIVAAREEERRRLRRDLHDSVGPMLATLSLQTEAARDLITIQPQQSDALLGDVLVKLQEVLGDIRRVVYGLRPPALDDLGLASALREQSALYSQKGISVRMNIEEPLPTLSAATEVAIYRVVQEALTNVIRHSNAHNTEVILSVDRSTSQVAVEIIDDGRGFAEGGRSGVGLHSMHERAAELSGSCQISSAPGKGTRIKVILPW